MPPEMSVMCQSCREQPTTGKKSNYQAAMRMGRVFITLGEGGRGA